MAALDARTGVQVIKEIEKNSKTEGMVQGIWDQAITEMVITEIMVAIVLEIQHKGTVELEVKSSVSNVRGGDI